MHTTVNTDTSNDGEKTYMPGTFELDDFSAFLVDVYFLLSVPSAVLNDDEEECTYCNRKGIPLSGGLFPSIG